MCFMKIALAARWRVDRWMQEDEEVVTIIPEACGASGAVQEAPQADAVGASCAPEATPEIICRTVVWASGASCTL